MEELQCAPNPETACAPAARGKDDAFLEEGQLLRELLSRMQSILERERSLLVRHQQRADSLGMQLKRLDAACGQRHWESTELVKEARYEEARQALSELTQLRSQKLLARELLCREQDESNELELLVADHAHRLSTLRGRVEQHTALDDPPEEGGGGKGSASQEETLPNGDAQS